MAKKDVLLSILDGRPVNRFVHPEDTHMILTPGERNEGGQLQPDGNVLGEDWFGCKWIAPPIPGPWSGGTIAPGGSPFEADEDPAAALCAVPTPEQVRAFDWKGWAEQVLRGYEPGEQLLFVRSMTGFFERLHCLVGFENALCAFYDYPEAVEALFQAILAYKKAVVDCICQVMQPDILCFDDDYGTAKSTFLSPDLWREFFPRYWRELVDHVHSKGVKFELHSCGYVTPLVGDFVELGMDILQPVQTHNDLEGLSARYGQDIAFRFAIFDKQMAGMYDSEEAARADLRKWYSALAGGKFLPELVPIDDPFYRIQAQFQADFEKELYGV